MKKYLLLIPTLLLILIAGQTKAGINAQDSIVFDLTKIIYLGDYASIPVYIISDDIVNSLDFSTKFDETGLTYDSTLNETAYISMLASFNQSDRIYRFTSSSIQQIENNKTLVLVRFIMLNGKKYIHADDLFTSKGYLNGDPCSIKFFDDLTINVKENRNVEMKLYPNPATNEMNVSVPENAIIEMTDMNGRQVIPSIHALANQKQEINTSPLTTGIYSVKIYNDHFMHVRKLIITK